MRLDSNAFVMAREEFFQLFFAIPLIPLDLGQRRNSIQFMVLLANPAHFPKQLGRKQNRPLAPFTVQLEKVNRAESPQDLV